MGGPNPHLEFYSLFFHKHSGPSWRRSRYPVGFLFGLGFDTSSEVALLAMDAWVFQATREFPPTGHNVDFGHVGGIDLMIYPVGGVW